MRKHPRRAEVDASDPRCWGTSDRSGMIGNLRNMVFQHDWRGTKIENLRFLVYPEELDLPQRQLGTIIIPPDPPPIFNTRPEAYYIDEQTYRVQMDGTVRVQMTGQQRLESNLQSGNTQ